ncbi:MAG: MBL fold metallo-hydrolase RNA specificity domain-containing protein [Acidimicrobiia bacterium]
MQPNSHAPSAPTLTFAGAAGTVTGSRFLVETDRARVLVDCGLFQGLKELRLRNWEPFPVDPASIDAVVLTHAHVDHSGYLPGLGANGFAGRIHCSEGTAALCRIVLPDSGHLQEEEAAYANRKGYSKHHPAKPLYTEADAHAVLRQLSVVPGGPGAAPVEIAEGITLELRRAGHILGACSAVLRITDGTGGPRTLVVSGDLGRREHPVLRGPEPLPAADTVLVESTYGDRDHDGGDGPAVLAEAINATARRGGVVVIPSFAVDRTEVLLYHLRRLVADGAVADLPVYVDSPMALSALEVYRRAVRERWPEIRPEVVGRGDLFDPGQLHEVRDVEASKRLHGQRYPSIIISASGMATGGRVLHHLAHRLGDRRNTVILAGYQAAGTRGRRLLDGDHQLKLLGRYVPVRAEVVDLPAFSVHADRGELLDWLGTAPSAPDTLYVVHGEAGAAAALRDRVEERLGWTAVVAAHGERVRLD